MFQTVDTLHGVYCALVVSSELVLHERCLLLTDRHSQGCWFDSRQVEPPHPERQLEEVLHGDSDPQQTETKTQMLQIKQHRSDTQHPSGLQTP